jgi:hypothetical protein
MALLVTCKCGHLLEAADEQAGRQVPCPSCGAPLQLPQPYNPLSTARYLQSEPAEPEAAPAVETPVVPSGQPCETCAGSGKCRYCHGAGQLEKTLLDRINAAIAEAFVGIGEFISTSFGASADPKKYQTKSEKRRAGACPGCAGSGKCFGCEGSGIAPMG